MSQDRVTVSTEQLVLSHTLQLTALVELLEEKGILTQQDVVERMKLIRDRKGPNLDRLGWGIRACCQDFIEQAKKALK